ncbi:hypothetical protein ACHAXT_001744 [Thalassiosira profunda]
MKPPAPSSDDDAGKDAGTDATDERIKQAAARPSMSSVASDPSNDEEHAPETSAVDAPPGPHNEEAAINRATQNSLHDAVGAFAVAGPAATPARPERSLLDQSNSNATPYSNDNLPPNIDIIAEATAVVDPPESSPSLGISSLGTDGAPTAAAAAAGDVEQAHVTRDVNSNHQGSGGQAPDKEPVHEAQRLDKYDVYACGRHVNFKRWHLALLGVLIVGACVAIPLGVVYGGKNSDDQSFDWTPELVQSIVAPVGLPKFQDAFLDETSPQARAVDWLSNGGGADIVTGPSLEAVEWRIRQRYALAVLYYATGGEEWTNQYGYLDSDKHECEWGGGEQLNNGWKSLDCADGDGRVTLINLWQNNLRGTLPVELASLSGSLTAIDLLTNQIEGTIPEELFRMKKLNYLNLGYNKFSGTVSAALGDLDQLTYLMLDNNEMTGTIPSELGKLTQLSGWLSLEGNKLHGTVPESFQDLTKATWIYLNYNDLTGSIEFLCDALKPVEAPGGVNADAASPLLELWADVDEVECSCCNCCPIVEEEEEEDPELFKPVEQSDVGG